MSIMIYIKIKNCKIKFSMDPVMLPLMLSPPTPKKPLTSKLDSRIVIEMNKYWTHKKDGRQKTSREQDLIKFFFLIADILSTPVQLALLHYSLLGTDVFTQ